MLFRQFFEKESSTYTYMIGCERTRQAFVIDPVISEVDEYLTFLNDAGYQLIYTMETHVHTDHISAAVQLRKYTGCRKVVHKEGGAKSVDLMILDGTRFVLGDIEIEARHTPGHTNACMSYVVDNMIFTGDTLHINGCGRTDYQSGDAARLYDSVHNKIYTLPDETLIYPGHDYSGKKVSTVGEQKKLNKRLSKDINKKTFIELMENLDLPLPKKINEALPANLACDTPQ